MYTKYVHPLTVTTGFSDTGSIKQYLRQNRKHYVVDELKFAAQHFIGNTLRFYEGIFISFQIVFATQWEKTVL